MEALIRRGIRSGFRSANQSPLSDLGLVEAVDNHLLNNILCNNEQASKFCFT